MLKTYSDYVSEYGSQYRFDKAVAAGEIYKIEDGIYSDTENVPELATIATKYPNAILSGEYAFYYHGFTDVIPEKYSMATKSKASKITDDRVFQIYVRYKEILLKYRAIIYSLQLWRIQEYADIFPKSKMIKKALDEEVM